jgi:hypothetical protein
MMNKLLFRVVLGIAALGLAIVLSSPVQAVCSGMEADKTIRNYPSAGACGLFCYLTSPGANSSSSIKADYWQLGAGSPTDGTGVDNGTYEWDGSNGSQPWAVLFTGGWSINTTINNGAATDGCPSVNPLTFQFSDTDAAGLTGYYATHSVANSSDIYDLGLHGGNIDLVQIPQPSITASSRPDTSNVTLTVSWTNNIASAHTTSNATAATTVVRKWRVLKRHSGSGDPVGRAVASWTQVHESADGTGGNTSASFTMGCSALTDDAYLALLPVYDSGFTPAYVGPSSTRIECDPNIAEPGTKFKVIKDKPGPNVIKPKKETEQ